MEHVSRAQYPQGLPCVFPVQSLSCTFARATQTFFCDGFLVAGPDWKMVLLSSALMLIPLVIFVVFVARDVTNRWSTNLPILIIRYGEWAFLPVLQVLCRSPGHSCYGKERGSLVFNAPPRTPLLVSRLYWRFSCS